MACFHNENQIIIIRNKIRGLQMDITNLKNNITKTTAIKQKHHDFNSKLQCVMTNLSDNRVEAGKTYDGGKMLKCSVDAIKTINECDLIITESNSQIKTIENTIKMLEQQIAMLDGNCSLCSKPSTSDSRYS